MFDRKEYIAQIIVILKEYKKLKEIRHVSGDMDILDELNQIKDFLEVASYNWKKVADEYISFWGFYANRVSKKERDTKWNKRASSHRALWNLFRHRDYVRSNYTLLEQIITEIEKEDLKPN